VHTREVEARDEFPGPEAQVELASEDPVEECREPPIVAAIPEAGDLFWLAREADAPRARCTSRARLPCRDPWKDVFRARCLHDCGLR
jgi:hypothetical protein